MARIARAVVTQRGNRRERVFFEEGDYALYRDQLGESCRFGVEVRAYCLGRTLAPRKRGRKPRSQAAAIR